MVYSTLDIAVLLEKSIILNGIIANSDSIENRRQAKLEFEALLPTLKELGNICPKSTGEELFK